MGTAANTLIKMIQECDNRRQFELDAILLKNFYDKKLQKECPFFEDTELNNIDNPV